MQFYYRPNTIPNLINIINIFIILSQDKVNNIIYRICDFLNENTFIKVNSKLPTQDIAADNLIEFPEHRSTRPKGPQ